MDAVPTASGSATSPEAPRTLPEKVDLLFRTCRPHGGGEYSLKEVQEGMRALGYKVSDSTLQQLRSGSRPNPTHHTLDALCKFFGVPAGYFFDEVDPFRAEDPLRTGDPDDAGPALELLALLRDGRVSDLVRRAAELPAVDLETLGRVVDELRAPAGDAEPADAPGPDDAGVSVGPADRVGPA
jgi:transcriptional regulator with XRE-family HTH domain